MIARRDYAFVKPAASVASKSERKGSRRFVVRRIEAPQPT
jgi:hypothetical protein